MNRSTPFYRPILIAGFRTALRERWLAGYALLAGLVIGSGFGSAILQALNEDSTGGLRDAMLHPTTGMFRTIADLFAQASATGIGATLGLAAFGLAILALIAAIVWGTVVGANALVLAAHAIDRGAAIPRPLARPARERVVPALALHLLAKAAALIVLLLWATMLASAASSNHPIATAGGIIAFTITILFLTIMHIVTPLSLTAIVLKNERALPAIRSAWTLLRAHTLLLVETSFLLTVLQAASIGAWMVSGFIATLPFIFLGGIGVTHGIAGLFTAATIGGAIILLALLVIIAAIATTVTITVWTTISLRITSSDDPPTAWVARLGT